MNTRVGALTVVPIKSASRSSVGDAPFQAEVKSLTSNELIFAVVGPVGSGTSEIALALEGELKKHNYVPVMLKARSVIESWARRHDHFIDKSTKLAESTCLQDAGDQVRETSKDNSAVAAGLVRLIRSARADKQNIEEKPGEPIEPDGEFRAYILDSLRHPDEVALLRRVYQEAFCLIGVFCGEADRLNRLQSEKYQDASHNEILKFMARDENAPEAHGQKVSDTFHLADYFIDNTLPRMRQQGSKQEENPKWDVPEQLGRLVEILTRKKIIRPRLHETGMFHAYGAKMRSSCLSRQVGAALIDNSGTLIATGTNEVPRAGGGVYGGVFLNTPNDDPEAEHDFRCYVHNGDCSNTKQQNAIIEDLFRTIDELKPIELNNDLQKRIRKTRIGQLLEFSRAVHAEMDALLAAARSGTKTVGTRMYVTTFPCHNCARHIVAAGVEEVQYIEPYLKSQAIPLHGDAIITDPKDWVRPIEFEKMENKEGKNPNVLFRPFIGVAPRLYRRAFLKDMDLKDNMTGEILKNFGPLQGHGTIDALKMSYAQAEAVLSSLVSDNLG